MHVTQQRSMIRQLDESSRIRRTTTDSVPLGSSRGRQRRTNAAAITPPTREMTERKIDSRRRRLFAPRNQQNQPHGHGQATPTAAHFSRGGPPVIPRRQTAVQSRATRRPDCGTSRGRAASGSGEPRLSRRPGTRSEICCSLAWSVQLSVVRVPAGDHRMVVLAPSGCPQIRRRGRSIRESRHCRGICPATGCSCGIRATAGSCS